jgi:hypothetical protein
MMNPRALNPSVVGLALILAGGCNGKVLDPGGTDGGTGTGASTGSSSSETDTTGATGTGTTSGSGSETSTSTGSGSDTGTGGGGLPGVIQCTGAGSDAACDLADQVCCTMGMDASCVDTGQCGDGVSFTCDGPEDCTGGVCCFDFWAQAGGGSWCANDLAGCNGAPPACHEQADCDTGTCMPALQFIPYWQTCQ